MQTKSLTIQEMDDTGKGLARIAVLSEIDHDGDTYAPGAFSWKDGGEQWAPLINAHDRWSMPFGKARVYEEGDAALAELHLNLETQSGRDWHAALKFDLATGKSVQEWSYGYDPLNFDYESRQNSRIRVLQKVDVHEVSTVIRGAGQGTGTLSLKGRNGQLKEARFGELVSGLDELSGALGNDPALLSATGRQQLGDIHVALGKALAVPMPMDEKERDAVENAVAAHLRSVAARHLPA